MKDDLKKGQAFIGIDDSKYYFLGYDYDNQIMFTNLDLWTDKEQKYIVKNNLFIKDILDEKSDLIEHSTWYYQSMRELEKSTNQEKVKRCLDIISNANTDEVELRPIKIGPLVRGQVYSSEFNQYYEVIGYLVENKIYIDNKFRSYEKGFFAIYHSNCDENVPLIFERGFKDKDNSFLGKCFIAGNNDKVDIKDEIISKDLVNANLDDEIRKILENNSNERVK
ncbi:MAG: hypothetical protein IJE04_00695 [Bacilli bacterium]|nr:hypothetical protein [Bacilli bacterium]